MNSKFFEKLEYQGLKQLYKQSPRNPRQINSFNTSDTEIIQIRKDLFLVSSTDSLAVEIHSGLYKSADTWGYLSVVNSISDLAASGAKPIGVLVSTQWEKGHSKSTKDAVYRSLSQALKKFKVPLLGGDSGSSSATTITTTILGESNILPLTRKGVHSGDLMILLGSAWGYGPALAFDYLENHSKNNFEKKFRPRPDWKASHILRKYFKAAIDTSDGILNSLETLAEINNVTIEIDTASLRLPKIIQSYQQQHNIPIEYFIESDLGDLQTCLAINPKIYSKIKSKLPFHQVIARVKKRKLASKAVYYTTAVKINNFKSLPDLLEQKKLDYSSALNLWLKQYR